MRKEEKFAVLGVFVLVLVFSGIIGGIQKQVSYSPGDSSSGSNASYFLSSIFSVYLFYIIGVILVICFFAFIIFIIFRNLSKRKIRRKLYWEKVK